jgi:zinc transport system substrate-binding protein
MRRNSRGLAAVTLLSLFAFGCGGATGEHDPDGGPVVVASIFPIGDLVQRMAGSGIRVEVVLPPGASPATFDVTPRQLTDLRNAALFLMIGGGLDEWTSRLPEASGGPATIVRLSEGIPLMAEEEDEHGHEHGTGNPHIWLDPILVRDQVLPKLEEALKGAFPEDSEGIEERSKALSDSLTSLDLEIREALGPLDRRAFIATHSAWTYFAARYGLEEAGVIHLHPGHEPSSRELAALLEVARSRNIPCLFTEPQLGEVAARALATELALPTSMLDPLGGPEVEGREGYFEVLRFNTRQLLEGLGGPGS